MGSETAFLARHTVIFFHLILLIRAAIISVFVWLAYRMGERMSPESAAFWKGVLSDGGAPSWSRVASSTLLIACLVWDTRFLFTTGALPNSGDLTSQALFISSPYLINTTGKAAMMIAGRPASPIPTSGDVTNVTVKT
jgi:hypothetical protein